MGIWDYFYSATDLINRNTANLDNVKSFCWNSYEYSRAAVPKIHNAVAVNGNVAIEKLNRYLPDGETRSQIAANLVKNSAYFVALEGVKFVPGGSTFANIVSKSLPRDKESKENKELLELKDKVGRIEKELSDYKKLLEKTEIQTPIMELKSKNTLDMNQNPEDMIRVFMMTEFMGKHFLEDLIVPGTRTGKHLK